MKEDLRVQKTKEAIEHAFVELIEQNGYAGVSITDIALRARISRNTFYLHYRSKEDLTDRLITSTFLDQFGPKTLELMLKGRLRKNTIRKIYQTVFRIIMEDINLYRLFLIDENMVGYIDRLIRKITDDVLKKMPDALTSAIGINYIVSGAYGVLRRWIIYDLGTVEENIALLTDLSCLDLKRLLRRP